uniref:Uncharacterized protein n=1 Tax=Talaromyces marneffei PM1 TaxID=1077442 RepID=A0A093VG96_TALMA
MDGDKAIDIAGKAIGILIATSASARSGMVGMGGYIRDTQADNNGTDISRYSITLGKRTEQNPYTAELEAIAVALERISPETCQRWISILSSNRSALSAISQPRQQSGQLTIRRIYRLIQFLQQRGNAVNAIWILGHADIDLQRQAKAEARKSTGTERLPEKQPFHAKSTTIGSPWRYGNENGLSQRRSENTQRPWNSSSRKTYKELIRWTESERGKDPSPASTGMIRLNSYLNRIGAAHSNLLSAVKQARQWNTFYSAAPNGQR